MRLAAHLLRAGCLVFGLFLSFAGPVSARDLEIRGTILCRDEGDPRRERPMEPRGLVLMPRGYPGSAEMLGEAGLFRLRVPYDLVDQEVVLQVYRDSQQIDLFPVFIEPGKVKRIGDKYIYSIASHVLPGKCEELSGNPELALQFRDQLHQMPGGTVQEAGFFRLPKTALGGIVAALLGAGAYTAQANPASEELSNKLTGSGDYPMNPGLAQTYAQFSSSPILGRTTTTYRNFHEAALWNPSLLVHTPGNHLSASGGVRNEYNATGSWHVPYRSESLPFYAPRVVSAAFYGLFWDHDDIANTIPGDPVERFHRELEERVFSVGLGFELSEAVAFGVNVHNYHQRFGVIREIETPGAKSEFFDERIHADENDLDVGVTWDAGEEVRFAATAYNVAGTNALDGEAKDIPRSRGVIGASIVRERFHAGAEIGLNAGEMNAAVGVNYRIFPILALDLAGGTRWQTVQTGIDITPGPVTGSFRVRWDDQERAACHLGVGYQF